MHSRVVNNLEAVPLFERQIDHPTSWTRSHTEPRKMLYHLKVKRTHAFVITLIICDRNRAFRVFRLWNVCSWEYCCIQLNPGSVMSLQWIELVCLMTTADLAEMCCRAQRVVRRTLIGFYLEEEIERAGLDRSGAAPQARLSSHMKHNTRPTSCVYEVHSLGHPFIYISHIL